MRSKAVDLPLRAGRGRDRDRNVGLAANPGLPHVPARPHRMALLSIGICWVVATINAQLSPGQNRQSSPLITPAYHGLESLAIAGQERLTDWLRIPAPPCLPPRPLEPARRSRRRGPTSLREEPPPNAWPRARSSRCREPRHRPAPSRPGARVTTGDCVIYACRRGVLLLRADGDQSKNFVANMGKR
jgi:hypothetical protein